MDDVQDVRRVEELWFDDADVVFQAGNLQFRIHRSILSARSPIFKDMFSVPQPAKERSISFEDGRLEVQVIYLPDDAQEVHYLFLAIFDSSFFEPPPSPTTIEIVTAILRLSHKYEVKYLFRRAVAHLNLMFPTDFHTLAASLASSNGPDLWLRSDEAKISMLRLIQPAYATSVFWILPSLFRRAVKIDLRHLFTSPEWRGLPVEMQEKFFLFRDAIGRELEYQIVAPHIHGDPDSCADNDRCQTSARVFAEITSNTPWSSDSVHVCWVPDAQVRLEIERGFCNACAESIIEASRHVAWAHWARYPSELGLSGWQTLINEKNDFATTS